MQHVASSPLRERAQKAHIAQALLHHTLSFLILFSFAFILIFRFVRNQTEPHSHLSAKKPHSLNHRYRIIPIMTKIDILLQAAAYLDASEQTTSASIEAKDEMASYSDSNSNGYTSSSSMSSSSSEGLTSKQQDALAIMSSMHAYASKMKPAKSPVAPPLATASVKSLVAASAVSPKCTYQRIEEIKRDKAIHNTLEKNRRAHLKECFENLQNELPQFKDKKVTNLSILNCTLKYVQVCDELDLFEVPFV